MAIGVVTRHLVRTIEAGLAEAAWPVSAASQAELASRSEPRIEVLLWRVEPDPATQGAIPLDGRRPARPVSAVILHYLVVVAGNEPTSAQDVLGRCMRALAATPVLTQNAPAPDEALLEGQTLQVAVEALDTATMLALWHALAVPLRLSAAYTVRGLQVV